jgi:hypothetical protein
MSNPSQTILHIGYQRTATTWFQKHLYPQISDITYLAHDDLPELLFGNPDEKELAYLRDWFEKINKRIVISDENLLGTIGNKSLYSNAAKFRKIFGQCHVVIFIRNQIEKYSSNYGYYIKTGGSLTFRKFLFLKDSEEIYGGQKHKYDILIDTYNKEFGAANISIFLFEEFRMNPKLFIHNFLVKLELEDRGLERDYNPENNSLSEPWNRIFRILNKFSKKYAVSGKSKENESSIIHIPYWHYLMYYFYGFLSKIRYFSGSQNHERILDDNNTRMISDYFRESNRNLISIHGLHEIKNYNYPI